MFQFSEVKHLITVFIVFIPDKKMTVNKIYCGL